MGFDVQEPEQRSRLRQVLENGDISVGELWLQYFSMSGTAGEYEVQAYLEGVVSLPVTERDLLAMAANELTGGGSLLRAPYSDELDGHHKRKGHSSADPDGEGHEGTTGGSPA